MSVINNDKKLQSIIDNLKFKYGSNAIVPVKRRTMNKRYPGVGLLFAFSFGILFWIAVAYIIWTLVR